MKTINVKYQDHFHEKGFIPHSEFLSEENYAMVLDNVVVTCVDICVINTKGQILLGKRTWYPMPNWWIIGGRMKPGESFNESASRNIKRELGLNISPDRFERLWEYSMA
ncbi:MAG: NUDIX domain-containing protein, partial [Nanoarchaeota archaeon]